MRTRCRRRRRKLPRSRAADLHAVAVVDVARRRGFGGVGQQCSLDVAADAACRRSRSRCSRSASGRTRTSPRPRSEDRPSAAAAMHEWRSRIASWRHPIRGFGEVDPLPFRPLGHLGTPENPLRVAIVGSGPAGFYAAEHLLKREDVAVEVDMFDRLPTPFGLVRAGVAPDHPKIKSVIRMYEKTAAREGFQFFGNVEIGARHHGRRARAALPRGRLRLRHGHRSPARDPRRGPARARTRRPSSSTGTTPTPISPTTTSTSRPSARS